MTAGRSPRGGMYYEDFGVRKLYRRDFCETETQWGQPLMNSLFTLG